MKIRFINAGQWRVDIAPLRRLKGKIEKVIRAKAGEVNVVFTDDKTIHPLNKAYRGKDKPTDVLSFDYPADPKDSKALFGELYISIETARRQAKEAGGRFQEELNKLFVHGILHLHGYDHERDEDYRVMHALECKILERKLPLYIE